MSRIFCIYFIQTLLRFKLLDLIVLRFEFNIRDPRFYQNQNNHQNSSNSTHTVNKFSQSGHLSKKSNDILLNRFFSRKRDASADERLKKGRTPEPPRDRSPGLTRPTNLSVRNNPQIKVSSVSASACCH